MADCTIRRRDESWIEVVLPTPTYNGELAKAHNIMLGQLGLDQGIYPNDDAYTVIVGDDEIILRAKAPATTLKVAWAEGVIKQALERLLDYRDNHGPAPDRTSQTVMVVIDCLRAVVASAHLGRCVEGDPSECDHSSTGGKCDVCGLSQGRAAELDRIARELAEQKADGTARRFEDVDAIREHLGRSQGGE